jgi:polysaccharide biosynthesis transport protein
MALPQSFVTVSRRPPDIEDYIDMLRRHRSWIIGPMLCGLVISTVVAFLWPDTYVSTAMLRIVPQKVSERLVPAEFTTQMAQRLTEMEQEIESRTTLESIITDPALNLYERDRQPGGRPMEDIVADMRHNIHIQPVQNAASNADSRTLSTAFSISFSYPDRAKAQAVVHTLVTKFTDQNHEALKGQAHATASFLEAELKQAQDRLTKLDNQITQFRLANNGKLPEELTSNTTMLNSLLLQQSDEGASLQRAVDMKSQYETQLSNFTAQLQMLESNTEDTITTAQSAAQNQNLVNTTATLDNLQEHLAAMQKTLGAKNPEITTLKAQIEQVQARKDRLEKEQQQKEANVQPAGPVKIVNRNVQSSILNLKGQIESTKTLIVECNANIARIQNLQENMAKRIAMYEQRIQSAPLNEREWAGLQREQALAQAEYNDQVKKRQLAETSQNLEERQVGETLELLDQPSDPQSPTEPKRPQWAAVGTGLGLLLGVVLAGAKEIKNTSLKNLKDVRAYTNLPVLSSIPLLENALLVRRKRRLFWVAWSASFLFGSMLVMASVYYYYVGRR